MSGGHLMILSRKDISSSLLFIPILVPLSFPFSISLQVSSMYNFYLARTSPPLFSSLVASYPLSSSLSFSIFSHDFSLSFHSWQEFLISTNPLFPLSISGHNAAVLVVCTKGFFLMGSICKNEQLAILLGSCCEGYTILYVILYYNGEGRTQ